MHQHPLRPPDGDPRSYSSMHCIGISHRTAPAELRERLAFPPEIIGIALSAARRQAGIPRLVIVSTCHRTELYAELELRPPAGSALLTGGESMHLCEWMAERTGIDPGVVMAHAYVHQGDAVVRHLFRLAAGLESLVPGEPQIVGQIAAALRHSIAAHAASPMLKRLFKEAVRTGEKARASAWCGHRAANIGTAAVRAAALSVEQQGLAFSNARVSIFGAGELGELALGAVIAAGARDVTIVNRTGHRADLLADRCGVRSRPFDQMNQCLAESDAAIFAMSRTRALVAVDMLKGVMLARQELALTLVDVALPRNVEPHARTLPGVTLFDIDDVGKLGQGLYAERASVAETVEKIVEDGLTALRARPATLPRAPLASATLQ